MNSFCHSSRETLASLCSFISGDALLFSMFREGASPVECPFTPPHTFTYNRGHGECKYPVSSIEACTHNSRLLLSYQACPDVYGSESHVEELQCIALWKEGTSWYLVGKMHHGHSTSNEDRFRCFVYEKINPSNHGHSAKAAEGIEFSVAQSGDATCNGLFSPMEGSRTMTLRKGLPTRNIEEACSSKSLFDPNRTPIVTLVRLPTRNIEEACSSKSLFDPNRTPIVTLVTSSPVQKKCPHEGKFQVIDLLHSDTEGKASAPRSKSTNNAFDNHYDRWGDSGSPNMIENKVYKLTGDISDRVKRRSVTFISNSYSDSRSNRVERDLDGFVSSSDPLPLLINTGAYKFTKFLSISPFSGLPTRNIEEACSSKSLFDPNRTPIVTLVTSSPVQKKCPHEGKFQVIDLLHSDTEGKASAPRSKSTNNAFDNHYDRWGDSGSPNMIENKVYKLTGDISDRVKRRSVTFISNSYSDSRSNRVERDLDGFVSSKDETMCSMNFKSLAVGCTNNEDKMEFIATCPNAKEVVTTYTCHGGWSDNATNTHYLITTPLSRRSRGAHRYCVTYRPGEEDTIYFLSNSDTCQRSINPGLGTMAFNVTYRGSCSMDSGASIVSLSIIWPLCLLICAIMTSSMLSR
ncbi:uncharacterized protein LOC113466007 [Diaphorina citri]|uniref:Uncharacterized protein LOC113466007 n=1 Tax=Diaphorina citri TaxID=121845 RepID=A0A3Q0IKZ3_DIACI|nr:uncharacterized protein LOC113466007 [Diaphorina citri]